MIGYIAMEHCPFARAGAAAGYARTRLASQGRYWATRETMEISGKHRIEIMETYGKPS